jgi:tRNA pseudouridine55 synthase
MKSNPAESFGPSGVLLVDKDSGMTSHDVVAIARRSLGTRKIGHCGTLDPMATGLLMLVVGRATKIQDLLMSEDKEYRGTLTLGISTSTQDREGEICEERPVPELDAARIEEAFASFDGDFAQMPPMVSAIKKDGVPLYKHARKGVVVEREARPVSVGFHRVERVALPEVEFTVGCSKGFYVRTYAHDIGERLGCGAHLSSLRRTRSGKFTLERAVTIADLKGLPREELLRRMVTLAEVSLMRGA